jgi:Ca-activated chloride channel family protein
LRVRSHIRKAKPNATAGEVEEEEEEEEEEADQVTFEASNALPTSGQAGVDLATRLGEMRNQSQVGRTTARQAAGRNCLKIRGVWIDEAFDGKMKTVTVKAMSAAYFRMMERQPQMREVFRLGNRIVWITPSKTALVIDSASGAEQMTDDEIDALFVAKQ